MRLANRYELLHEIGRGAVGIVYLANDPRLERRVAIKMLPPHFLNTEAEERFRREVRVISRFDHPSIVVAFDVGEHNGSLFYVMPYVEGSNLRALLKQKQLSASDVVEIGYQAADALDYSHQREVIHRDVKPENIMVVREADGLRAKITDFGLAIASDQKRLTQTGKVVGTIGYLSPEQVQDQDADARSDIYSLATVLYECLSGKPPFSGDMQWLLYRIAHETAVQLSEVIPDIDPELNRIIMRCLHKDPEKRPQRAKDLAKELLKCRLADTNTPALFYRRSVQRNKIGLAGREKEIGKLTHLLKEAQGGSTHFVLISGEAGIGKTRLASEAQLIAHQSGMQVLQGRFAEFDHALPFPGYQEMLQQALRSESIAVKLSGLSAELIELFPSLEESFSIRSSPDSLKPSFNFQDRAYIFDLLTRAFSQIAASNPLCLIMEDLHDANTSVDLLEHWIKNMKSLPMLVIGTYRHSQITRNHPARRIEKNYMDDPSVTLMRLERLSQDETGDMLKLLCGKPIMNRALISIYESTDGNPFFVQELSKSLIDSGALSLTPEGEMDLSDEPSTLVLPLTIEQVIDQRLEELSRDVRTVLATASICGRTFEPNDLQVLLPEGIAMEQALVELISNGILVQEEDPENTRMYFASGLVRQAVYKKLPGLRRKSLHKQFANLLEQRAINSPGTPDPQLLIHYAHAGISEKVIPLAVELGLAALRRYSPEDAIVAAKTALDFMDLDDPQMRVTESKARSILAEAHLMQSNYLAALEEFEQSVRCLEETPDSPEALNLITLAAETAWKARRMEEARRWVEYGITRAEQNQDMEKLTQLKNLATLLVTKS